MTPEPESSSGERKRSRPATRREIRLSLQRWSERFDQVLMARTQTAKILDEWGFPVGFVKGALWVYHCGPGEEVVSRSLKSCLDKGSLCERMNAVADDLDRIVWDCEMPLLTCLNETAKPTHQEINQTSVAIQKNQRIKPCHEGQRPERSLLALGGCANCQRICT